MACECGFNDGDCRALKLFKSGYNCAQSVFAAHAPALGIDEETALKLSAPLGAGVGRMREVCGAFLGASMLLGIKKATTSNTKEAKAEIYERTQRLAEIFIAENGALLCRDLLKLKPQDKISANPAERTKQYYDTRPCPQIVARASAMVEREC